MDVFDRVFVLQVDVVEAGFSTPGKNLFEERQPPARLDLFEEVGVLNGRNEKAERDGN